MNEMLTMLLQVTHGIFEINTDVVSHEESLYQRTESGSWGSEGVCWARPAASSSLDSNWKERGNECDTRSPAIYL